MFTHNKDYGIFPILSWLVAFWNFWVNSD